MKTYKSAFISTVHITENDASLLKASGEKSRYLPSPDSCALTIAGYREGFFIPLGDGEEWMDETQPLLLRFGLSNSFCNLLRLCVKNGVFMLQLDSDGDKLDELPQHDW